MTKNINNFTEGGGISVSSTDSVPEGVNNLYYTSARSTAAIGSDPNYKNAESLFLVPMTGPSTIGGQILISDGAIWQLSKSAKVA